MKSYLYSFTAGVLALAVSALHAAPSSIVFNETFDYADQNALMAVWTKADTTVSTPNVGSNNDVPGSPYLTAPNSLISRSLDTTISASIDWTLSFDIIHTAYQRGGWVGLFDADGTNGYLAMWDSGNSAGTETSFSIRSYSSDSPLTTWNPTLTSIQSGSFSISKDTKGPIFDADTNNEFVTITLSWNAEAQTLSLETSVGGTATTAALPGFDVSKIYIRGNSTVYFDNVIVCAAIPEPASVVSLLGVLGLLCAGLIRWGRAAR